MNQLWFTHDDTREYVYPIDRNTLYVKVRCAADAEYAVHMIYWNKFDKVKKECKLESWCWNGKSEFHHVRLAFDETVKYLAYYFEIRGNLEVMYYSVYGLSLEVPDKYFEYPGTNEQDIFTVPSWAKGAVGYQIFPERFFNGDASNDPPSVEWWGEPPSRDNFFGGDLRGIIERFHHIKDLGIEVVYLTPIFHSPSNHKYDTIDYFAIDPSFGTLEDLRELVQLCHRHRMKVILDGVFHHIGYYSEPFQDAMIHGRQSKYWDWFYVQGDRIDPDLVNYECVGYYKWMPKLKFANPEVRAYFLSVGEYWIREAGIDGWRLDVADEVDFTFWQEFRRAVKQTDREILLIGETWKNGMDLLRGDQMDTIMNYRFRDSVIDYFAHRSIDGGEFRNRIESMLHDYPHAAHPVLYNLLDSHDTARFLTTCLEDIAKFKLAVAFQMTFPGMPFIYYGDEIGMTGETDPDCRRTMAWESQQEEILSFYRQWADLRQSNDAIRYGDFRHLDTGGDGYGFSRSFGQVHVIALFNNRNNKCKISIKLDFQSSSWSYDTDLPGNGFELIRLEWEGAAFNFTILAQA